jgi:epoxide hydrolase-like predicted phosphatase
MPIKAVIWDIGGVIARTEDRSPRDQLADDLGVTREYLNDLFFSGPLGIRAQKGEISVSELMSHIRSELALTSSEFPDLQERFFAGDMIDYKLVDFIRTLKPRYKTGVISNAWGQLDELLAEWEIADAFDVVIGSGDEGIMKPDPAIFRLALERLGIEPGEAVFIDDFIENIQGARAVGMQGIHFLKPEQALGDLKVLLEIK